MSKFEGRIHLEQNEDKLVVEAIDHQLEWELMDLAIGSYRRSMWRRSCYYSSETAKTRRSSLT
jgi:hypothetical protein